MSKNEAELGPWQLPVGELCCVNANCADRGRRGAGNVLVCRGKGGGRWRVVRCSTCKAEFSERKGTALWGTRMAPEKAAAIASHLKEGCGIRKTARLVGASKDGVTSIAIRLGLHARALHEERAYGLTVREAQLDEKWAFVEKKQKNCDPDKPEDATAGDQWDHTAIDVDSRFVVFLAVGKRSIETLTEVVRDFAERTGGAPPPLITTDDSSTYPEVLLKQYGETVVPSKTGKAGRPRLPHKRWPVGSVYATVNKTYAKGTVTVLTTAETHSISASSASAAALDGE